MAESRVSAETAAVLAPAFKALGDPVRLQLMSMIASADAGETCVCDLTPRSPCPARRSPTTSRPCAKPASSTPTAAARGSTTAPGPASCASSPRCSLLTRSRPPSRRNRPYDERVTAPPDVLVVGGGPTGLAMAAQLLAHGVRPRVIDRNLDRARESRALAIQPRTLEVLAALGVTGELVRLGNPNVRLLVHAGRKTVPIPMFDLGFADTPYPFLLFLSQAHTEQVLTDHLSSHGVEVERGVELTGLNQDAGIVHTTVRHRGGQVEHMQVPYVVGCDGGRSTVRELAGIAFEGSSYPQTFVLADVDADGLDTGTAHVFVSPNGMLFFFPLVSPAAWRVLAMRPLADPGASASSVTLQDVQTLADRYTNGVVRLRDPVWMTNFRLHHRAAAQYRAQRIFLAGDAAHIHSPAGAQGMNTGIQDAVNLAWKLAHTLHWSRPRVHPGHLRSRAGPHWANSPADVRPRLHHRDLDQPDRPVRPRPRRTDDPSGGSEGRRRARSRLPNGLATEHQLCAQPAVGDRTRRSLPPRWGR